MGDFRLQGGFLTCNWPNYVYPVAASVTIDVWNV